MSRWGKKLLLTFFSSVLLLSLIGCTGTPNLETDIFSVESSPPAESSSSSEGSENLSEGTTPMQTGMISEQVLEGETGTIHYSYFIPENYDENQKYPLMVAMPGYDMMWFGEESSGANLNWSGFLCWAQLPEDMIVVSAQLTDWHETSARQAIELTEYFIDHFSVDNNHVYAAGYSAGGETMSQAVSMRPDLYAAYLHGASQWDGEFTPVVENSVAVYIFMAENDEYYGSERALNAYSSLRTAYENAGWTADEIDTVLQIQTPDNEWFAERGVTGNYHGGGNVVFDETDILEWIVAHDKGGK
ncbi:MAG: prolyl oligopeptidase family serine peptidase [Massilioclostridium sp.]|nr:prolyl oligopeptidase family serine peptidase [Massilioclostridium sp.]